MQTESDLMFPSKYFFSMLCYVLCCAIVSHSQCYETHSITLPSFCLVSWADRVTNKGIDKGRDGQMDGQTDRWTTDGRTERHTDGLTDGWADGRTDG